jgi:hypothetical protein
LINGSDDLCVELALDCEECEFTFTDCDEGKTKYIFDGTGTLIRVEPDNQLIEPCGEVRQVAGKIECRKRLGGMLKYYHRKAA